MFCLFFFCFFMLLFSIFFALSFLFRSFYLGSSVDMFLLIGCVIVLLA